MLGFHYCKTKECEETCLDDAQSKQLRQKITDQLASHKEQSVHETLLKCKSNLTFHMDESSISIPLHRSISGLFLITVTIDTCDYRFVLDTGAQVSGISERLIQKHWPKKLPGTLSIGSIGGKMETMQGYLFPEISIASLTIHEMPMIALQSSLFQFQILSYEVSMFDGIIGWDILSHFDFEIDDIGKQWKLLNNRFSFPHPNMVKASFPVFIVKDAKGNVLPMGFDSGAKISWMDEKKLREYGYSISGEAVTLGMGVHGLEEIKIKQYAHMELYLYKAKIQLYTIPTGRTNVFPNVTLAGILGNEIFRNRRIRIVNSKEMVLLR